MKQIPQKTSLDTPITNNTHCTCVSINRAVYIY